MEEVTTNEKDGFTGDNGELAMSALYNLENIGRMGLGTHPLYQIAHSQLKALADRLNAD